MSLSLGSVVLASSSRTRLDMLRAAGLNVEAVPSGLNEAAMIAGMSGGGDGPSPADVATVLAEAKAQTVSEMRAGSIVIGADQTLELDGELFTKPDSVEQARRNLLKLRGKSHFLHSAVTLVRDGETLWSLTDSAMMTMRDFTPEFVGHYSAAEGETMLDSVGCYRLEGPGVQLFDKIDGDWFTILGLPLLPLLARLRELGVLET
ncbi:Maf family protein [Microbaculum marinum]|uniref:Nucleoside triphosphate pyrophosphatase n=2 Tax=Microbaculum marinum TaxID=1764581 RepID=A0AAW9S5D7_9HYPH